MLGNIGLLPLISSKATLQHNMILYLKPFVNRLLLLTLGAKMRAAAGGGRFLNGRLTFSTRLTRAIIDAQESSVISLAAGAIQKISKGGAAMLNGFFQNFRNAFKYFFSLQRSNGFDTSLRAHAGAKTNFVHVDVAETGDEFLVEE